MNWSVKEIPSKIKKKYSKSDKPFLSFGEIAQKKKIESFLQNYLAVSAITQRKAYQ